MRGPKRLLKNMQNLKHHPKRPQIQWGPRSAHSPTKKWDASGQVPQMGPHLEKKLNPWVEAYHHVCP